MTGYVVAPAGFQSDVAVVIGPRLTAGIGEGAHLAGHRQTWREPPRITARQLLELLHRTDIRGRGGAGFPFVRKLQTAVDAGKRREMIVNASEGEPGSAKDSAMILTFPHLMLDGAEVTAGALGVRTIRIMVPGERHRIKGALNAAIAERDGSFTYEVFETSGGFVGGQARAVLEAIEGRPNLPVTSWQPEAIHGYGGRPTLLSNAETFAQIAALVSLGPAAYGSLGTDEEPGTTLLTIAGDGPGGVVLEVPFGTPLAWVLETCGYDPNSTVLLGGYHGAWLRENEVIQRRVSRTDLIAAGATIGAGIILPLDRHSCPVVLTARIVEYLAGQSARRCGPCKHGLPALAESVGMLADRGGFASARRAMELLQILTRRGSCAHPDGTIRLVSSLLKAFPDEVTEHERGRCTYTSSTAAVSR